MSSWSRKRNICICTRRRPHGCGICISCTKNSSRFVHLGCLRHWVRGKLDLSESSSGTYFYKPMACELCKTQYATHMADTVRLFQHILQQQEIHIVDRFFFVHSSSSLIVVGTHFITRTRCNSRLLRLVHNIIPPSTNRERRSLSSSCRRPCRPTLCSSATPIGQN